MLSFDYYKYHFCRIYFKNRKFISNFNYKKLTLPFFVIVIVILIFVYCLWRFFYSFNYDKIIELPNLNLLHKFVPPAPSFDKFYSLIAGSAVELHVVSIIRPSQVREAREWLGSILFFCPKCSVIIYSFGLSTDIVKQFSSFRNVFTFDVYSNLFLTSSYESYDLNSPFYLFSSVYSHFYRTFPNANFLYLDVDYALKVNLDKVYEVMKKDGVFLVNADKNNSGYLSLLFFGVYSINGIQANITQIKKFNSYFLSNSSCACKSSQNCFLGSSFNMPVYNNFDFRPNLNSYIENHTFDNITAVIDIPSKYSINIDVVDASLKKKKHNELEIFGEKFISLIHFDLSNIYGDIEDIKLFLYPLWLANSNLQSIVYPKEFFGNLWVSYIDDISWIKEDFIPYKKRPLIQGELSTIKKWELTSDFFYSKIEINLTKLCLLSNCKKQFTIALSSDFEDYWLKLGSSYSNNKPTISVVIKGQGQMYQQLINRIK